MGHLFPNEAKYEERPAAEERVTALLVSQTEKNNVHYRHAHAARAAREPVCRAALVVNLDCADLTEKGVQEHIKTAIKKISNTC